MSVCTWILTYFFTGWIGLKVALKVPKNVKDTSNQSQSRHTKQEMRKEILKAISVFI